MNKELLSDDEAVNAYTSNGQISIARVECSISWRFWIQDELRIKQDESLRMMENVTTFVT
jgi:hypothetical protein